MTKSLGGRQKLPISTAGSPNFCDLAGRAVSPATQTHQVLSKMIEIQKDSLESDPQGKFNLSLNRLFRDLRSGEFFLWQPVYFIEIMENKADFKRRRPGIVIGRFGRKFALVYYRGNSIDTI